MTLLRRLALAVAVLGVAAPALAAPSPPHKPAAAEKEGPPQSLLPTAPPAATDSDGVPEGEIVEVAPLTDLVSPDRTGTFSAHELGLPEQLWGGSNGLAVAALLDRLAQDRSLELSPALWQVLGDLMLVGADEPGAPTADAPLLARRAAVLQRLGRHDDVAALADGAPEALKQEPVARGWMERRLLAGDAEDFCGDLEPLKRRFDTAFWRRLDLFCKGQGGDFDAVSQGISTLAEDGHADALDDALLIRSDDDGTAPSPELLAALQARAPEDVTPLDLALVANAGIDPPEAWSAAPDPAIAAAVADGLPAASLARLEAAERLAVLGVVGPEALKTAYLAWPATPEQVAAALQPPAGTPPAVQRALLVAALVHEGNPLVKAELFAGLVQRLAPQGNAGILLQQLGGNLPLGQPTAFLAPDMARLLLLQGPDPYILRPALAGRWLALIPAAGAATPPVALLTLLRQIRSADGVPAPPGEDRVALDKGLADWLRAGPGWVEDKRVLLSVGAALVPAGNRAAATLGGLEALLPPPLPPVATHPLPAELQQQQAALSAAERRNAAGEALLRGVLMVSLVHDEPARGQMLAGVAGSWQRLGLERQALAVLEETLIDRLHRLRFADAAK